MNFFNRNLERTQNQAVGVIKFLFSWDEQNRFFSFNSLIAYMKFILTYILSRFCEH